MLILRFGLAHILFSNYAHMCLRIVPLTDNSKLIIKIPMIMKNQLLNLKMIALMCLMMVLGGANVWAEQYKIVFAKSGTDDDGSKSIQSTTKVSTVVSEGINYVSGFTNSNSKAFYKSAKGLKLASNRGEGTFEFNIADSYKQNIKKIIVVSAQYLEVNSTLSLYSGSTLLKSGITPSEGYTHVFTEPTTVSSLKFVTKGKQAYISEIILETAESNTPTLVASESALDFGAVENNTSKNLTFKLSGSKLTADATLSVSGDYFTVTPTSVAQTAGTIAETDVTVSYNPTAVGLHTATLTISSTGAEAKTITLTGKSANAYTVAWNVNGNVYTDGTPTTNVLDGEKVTVLPTTPSDINGKVFVGWTNASLSAPQDAAPKVLFTDVADAPKVTGDVTYYAVFAKRVGDGEVTYTKLTSNQFKTDATYVIGAQQLTTNNTMWYFNGNVDKNWGRMSSTTSIESLMTFTLSGSASALVVKGENGKYLSTSSTSGKFYEMSLEETKIILTSNGTIKYSGNTLRHNYLDGDGGLRWYSGTTGVLAYFYEVSGGYTYSGYCTTVAEPTYNPATVNFVAYAGADYYATFSNAKVVFMPKNVTISAVTVENNDVVMRKSTEGVLGTEETVNIAGNDVAGYYIPANTGVLLNLQKGGEVTYYTVENKDVAAYNAELNNMLMPSVAGGEFTAEPGKVYYKLAYNDYNKHEGLGFYWGANDGGAFKVKAGTAYLAVPASDATAKGFAFNGEATGIEGVNANVENAKAIYNLNGQRVASMAKPGLYIVNGKKVVRK